MHWSSLVRWCDIALQEKKKKKKRTTLARQIVFSCTAITLPAKILYISLAKNTKNFVCEFCLSANLSQYWCSLCVWHKRTIIGYIVLQQINVQDIFCMICYRSKLDKIMSKIGQVFKLVVYFIRDWSKTCGSWINFDANDP